MVHPTQCRLLPSFLHLQSQGSDKDFLLHKPGLDRDSVNMTDKHAFLSCCELHKNGSEEDQLDKLVSGGGYVCDEASESPSDWAEGTKKMTIWLRAVNWPGEPASGGLGEGCIV